ncbi:MAG TPA: ABC transporter permease [Devosia sp.]|nr:ABC transporter permease [Devosia sp.]
MTNWQRLLAIVAGLSALGAAATMLPQIQSLIFIVGVLGALTLARFFIPFSFWIDGVLAVLAGVAVLTSLGQSGPPLWLTLIAMWVFAWLFIDRLATAIANGEVGLPGIGVLVPIAFGITLLAIWEAVVQGFNINHVFLPPPSAIWAKLTAADSVAILWKDFQQTFLKGVLSGFALGTVAGLAVAILVDRSPFLKRGILPIGNFASALPIVGIAPIMVMWFGYDWQSKAAVILCVTFFPMLINTLAGLNSAGRMEGDMMRTYAASYWQSLLKLRLPAAMPFIFNALKINSTLALIAAIVAEFFGSPIVGMGFRISTGVGRLDVEMVWAEVAVAAVAGSASYGLIALIERAVTFWHPSVRGGRA